MNNELMMNNGLSFPNIW